LRRLPILRPAFQLTSSLRLPSIFRLTYKPNFRLSSAAAFSSCLRTDLRLAPLTDSPASPSCQPFGFRLWSTFWLYLSASLRLSPVANLPASAFKPNLRLPSGAGFAGRLRTDLRLAPPIDPPASPSCQPFAFASGQPSGCVFQLTFDFRLGSTFRPCL